MKSSSGDLSGDLCGAVRIRRVVCEAPVNIAVVKYWGKRDENLIIPLNDSISVTLSTDHLRARTDISLVPGSYDVNFQLNGKREQLSKRFNTALRLCREEATRQRSAPEEVVRAGLDIVSDNNFPTAAGLASSAAGFACLVSALKTLYGIDGDISRITRQGCGSACRSVFGGFARWYAGHNPDGSDSVAEQLCPASHWPELRILILVLCWDFHPTKIPISDCFGTSASAPRVANVAQFAFGRTAALCDFPEVNDQKKETASTSGMRESAETSELLHHRARTIVPKRCDEMETAIRTGDFSKFAEMTMRDSNQLHAVCLDTYPPIVYLNDVSHSIIQLVHRFNQRAGKNLAAYTFDAGPNAFLFTTEDQMDSLLRAVLSKFPSRRSDFLRGMPYSPRSDLQSATGDWLGSPMPDGVQYIILTKPGEGPRVETM